MASAQTNRNSALKKLLSTGIVIFVAMVALPVFAEAPEGSFYLDGGTTEIGLILCHGRGAYPTWKVVDPLRKKINEQLGYHTLSLQMPNENKHWKEYAKDFPEAFSRIQDAIHFLKEEKGVNKVFLMGHSMGSRMASAYLKESRDQSVNGLIIAGCQNNGGTLFNCMENVNKLKLPILDIWGGEDERDSNAAREREKLQSSTYTQKEISGANHKFDGYENLFVSMVSSWLEKQ